jgi:hypothetical protein
MKYLIRTILKEYISNEKLIDDYISQFVRELKNIVSGVGVEVSYGRKNYVIQIINYDQERDSPIIAKIIRKWKQKLLNYGIVVGSQESDSTRMGYNGKIFFVSFKSMTTRRIKPNKFVFHASEVDPSIIFGDGITPKSSDEGKWTHHNLAYPPAVFAGNTYDNVWGGSYIYIIDTTKASNAWWYDLNEFGEGHLDYSKKLIMTFEPVLPDTIVGVMTFEDFHNIVKKSADKGASNKEIESMIEEFLEKSSY